MCCICTGCFAVHCRWKIPVQKIKRTNVKGVPSRNPLSITPIRRSQYTYFKIRMSTKMMMMIAPTER